MADLKLYGSFVAEKISKIRFVQEKYKFADSFITGSWGSSTNSVNLWKLVKDDFSSSDDADNDYVPNSISKILVDGDVTGLEFINAENIVCSTSSNKSQLLFINYNTNVSQNNLTQKHQLENLHKYENNLPAACTGLSIHELNIATVGEDGSVNILSSQGRLIRSFQNVDSCSIASVAFVNHNEILTGNRIGIVNIFDVRNNENKPSNSLTISTEDDKRSNCVTAITFHPDQKHIVICGSQEGSLTVWDLRQPAFPASYLSAHDNSSIADVTFHKTDPSKLFTASESGELFQWSYKSGLNVDGQTTENINPWLCGERTKNKINWTPLLKGIKKAVNACDSSGSRVICGCDNEAVYIIDNI